MDFDGGSEGPVSWLENHVVRPTPSLSRYSSRNRTLVGKLLPEYRTELVKQKAQAMPTAAEYEEMIGGYDDWTKLESLWEAIKARDTPGWAPGKAFEYLVLQAFLLDGGVVRWPFSVLLEGEEIEQIDGVVHLGRFSCLVESKHTAKEIAIAPLAKMRNQLLRRHSGTIGLIFSYAGFTGPAVILARYIAPQSILLWTGEEVEQVLRDQRLQHHLEFKYRSCVETGIPNASIQELASFPPASGS